MNNDSIDDLILGDGNGELFLFKGLGIGEFESATKLMRKNGTPVSKRGYTLKPLMVDWNGDGKIDLLLANARSGTNSDFGTIMYYKNVGTKKEPLFSYVEELKTTEGKKIGGVKLSIDYGDVDGDTIKDLVVSCYDGKLKLYKNSGINTAPIFKGHKKITLWGDNVGDHFVYYQLQSKEQILALAATNKYWFHMSKEVCNVTITDYNRDGTNELMIGYGGWGGDSTTLWGTVPLHYSHINILDNYNLEEGVVKSNTNHKRLLGVKGNSLQLFNVNFNMQVEISLYSINGRRIDTQIRKIENGCSEIDLQSLFSCSSGSYIVMVHINQYQYGVQWLCK